MSRTWSAYFEETRPEDYRFLDFYEYRLQQSDFTFSFRKESDKLKKDLDILITNGSDKMKKGARLLNESFKAKVFFLSFSAWLAGRGRLPTQIKSPSVSDSEESEADIKQNENMNVKNREDEDEQEGGEAASRSTPAGAWGRTTARWRIR